MLACIVLVVCLRRRYVRSKLPHGLPPAWQPSNQLRTTTVCRVGDSTQTVLGSAHMNSMQPMPALVSATSVAPPNAKPIVVEGHAFAKTVLPVAPSPYMPPPVPVNFSGADVFEDFDLHKI